MSFNKHLVAYLSILAILPGAAIQSVNANTPSPDTNDIETECVNYMVTSGGEKLCLDSAFPAEPEAVDEPAVGLDCSSEPMAEAPPQSTPPSVNSAQEAAEATAETDQKVVVAEETEPEAEGASAAENAPTEKPSADLLADAACSPEAAPEAGEPST